MNIDEFCSHYPQLFHMAHIGAWESINRHGLLSTTAILDLFEIPSNERSIIESAYRPESITLAHPIHGSITIRDNKPLPESKLAACLTDMTPTQWYRCLNRKVFFWPTRERVLTLLSARAYRRQAHTVMTIDARSLVTASGPLIHLSRINSGAAIYQPTARGSDTFVALQDWPREIRPRAGGLRVPIAEVAVEYSVPGVALHTIRVEEMRDGRAPTVVWTRQS